MRIRSLLSLLAVLGAPSVASAQIVFAPPPIYLPAPPPIVIHARFRWRRPRVWIAPQPVYIAPPPQAYAPPPVYIPPPPVYYAPPPPVYYAPPPPPVYVAEAPVYYAPPVAAAPFYVARPAPVIPPPWSARIGLGVRGTGQVVNDNWNNVGIGGEFLIRASAHVSTEIASEYQKNTNGSIDRVDVPTTVGVRLHLGKPSWIVSPYFVIAAGLDVAWQDLKVATDTAYFFDGQLGGGLELRLGQHVAITADARFDGKKRVNEAEPAVLATRSVNGKPVSALGDQYGGQFRLGFALYF